MKRPTTAERLDAAHSIDANGCWVWTGRCDASGYPRFKLDKRQRLAHRVTYEMLVGPIPSGFELDHLCRVTRCVNPEHLEPVTRAENMRRRYALVTRCVNGHAFDDANTYIRPDGFRDCRACIRERVRQYRQRQRAA